METRTIELASVIKDIAAGPFGSNLKVSCFVEEGFPIIDGANLKGIKVTDNVTKFVTEEKARSLHRSIASRGDVVVTISGNVGQIAYIPNNSQYAEYLVSQRQFRVTFDTEQVYVPYLVYYFHTYEGQHKILAFANQTGVPALAQPLKNFKKITVNLPTLNEQKQIASICEAITGKIETNDQINDNLEQQAATIYKSWFVDFSSAVECEMVDSEIGKIPRGWRVYRLSEFLPVITGKKNANVSSDKGEYPFFSCSQDFSWTDDYSFEGHAILVAGNGDFNVKWYKGKFEAYQRTYVLIPYEERYTSWLYYAVKYNLARITSAARGSVIKFITKGNLEDFAFAAPSDLYSFEIIDTFAAINRKIDCLTQENYRLAAIRDAILPRLMRGEIDVSNIDI